MWRPTWEVLALDSYHVLKSCFKSYSTYGLTVGNIYVIHITFVSLDISKARETAAHVQVACRYVCTTQQFAYNAMNKPKQITPVIENKDKDTTKKVKTQTTTSKHKQTTKFKKNTENKVTQKLRCGCSLFAATNVFPCRGFSPCLDAKWSGATGAPLCFRYFLIVFFSFYGILFIASNIFFSFFFGLFLIVVLYFKLGLFPIVIIVCKHLICFFAFWFN